MQCYKGIQVRGSLVPCGQCMNCRINAGRAWTSRMLMEQSMTQEVSWFVTLTYDEDHVPRTVEGVQTLRKREFQDWIRTTNRRAGPFRYYAVGEYGDDTMRPHYHMAIFPQPGRAGPIVTDHWDHGFTSAYDLSHTRARYLANYTTKKLTKDTDQRLEAGQEPEFRSSSTRPGLGAAFVPVVVSHYRSGAGQAVLEERGDVERVVRFGQKVYPIPRYILDKCRVELGIPTRHEDRLQHEGYYEWNQVQEAVNDPAIAITQERIRNAETEAKRFRTRTSRI